MSLINTRMQALIAKRQLDKNMARAQEYGALDLFATDTLLSEGLKELAKGSIGNDVKVPVLDHDGNVTVANSRSCTIAANENTSNLITMNFSTLAVGFTMTPSLEMNNYITTDEDFERKMTKSVNALADAADQMAVTALNAGKTQVFNDTLFYTPVANAIQCGFDGRMEIMSDIDSMMRANAYRGQLHIVGNAGIDNTMRKVAQHGLYNDVNKRLEFENKIFHFTNNITNGSGVFGSFFAVESGTCGLLTRFDRESFRKTKTAIGHEWGRMYIPELGFEVGYHYYQDAGAQDTLAGSASADMTCVLTEHLELSVDLCFLTAYNSDPTTIANPIIKGEILRSGYTNPYAAPVWVENMPSSGI